MSEIDVISHTDEPISKEDLIRDFKALGLQQDDHVILHVSLSKIGWIIGAEVTLIKALQEVLSHGTIVMATQTGQLSNPRRWENPPVPSTWHDKIIKHMPYYDQDLTPPYHLGRVAQLFYKMHNVYRSHHPSSSFSAWGHYAKPLTETHSISPAFGDGSPIEFMRKHQFKVLSIGTSYDTMTVLHYAETKKLQAKKITQMYFVNDGKNQTHILEVEDIDYDTQDFLSIGEGFEQSHTFKRGKIGQATTTLIPVNELIESAIQYFNQLP